MGKSQKAHRLTFGVAGYGNPLGFYFDGNRTGDLCPPMDWDGEIPPRWAAPPPLSYGALGVDWAGADDKNNVDLIHIVWLEEGRKARQPVSALPKLGWNTK